MTTQPLEQLSRLLLDGDAAGRMLLADVLALVYDGQSLSSLRHEHARLHVENARTVLEQLDARAREMSQHMVTCPDCGREATFPGGWTEGRRSARAAGWHAHAEPLDDCGTLCPDCTRNWPGRHTVEG